MNEGARLYAVLQRIRPVHELSARAVGAALEGTDLTVPLRAVLERLHDDGPQTVPSIARRLYVTRQGVQTLVDRARELGLVQTRPNPEHRRSHLVALTPRGEETFTTLHAAETDRLVTVARGLDPADVAACVRVLDHLVTRLEELITTTERNDP
ncbi:MarR family winged helix-turn-helix transcriptional regulator [Ornithinimicrobium cavernae]|uniref:MarR family winged helix-turn-helix transcriptional regulator n=1 Tax=Ornithinimicrobium cavernae TaxID=2666047 RepID=UPI000D695CA4|nr:MarR family winged helix-turn-helix transcriptional regulator [Ornithinimicrobium cavernae]